MLLGGPAFLHQATASHYKTAIFDLGSTCEVALLEKIDEQLKLGIKPELVKILTADGKLSAGLPLNVEKLYFYWLATHQGSNSGGPIWLFDWYSRCFISTLPTYVSDYIPNLRLPTVRLPPQLIKEYFFQPDAQVIHGDDFLVLIDEFLRLISA